MNGPEYAQQAPPNNTAAEIQPAQPVNCYTCTMQVVQHTHNLSSQAVRGARRQWPLANQQDGAVHTALLSLVTAQEAQDRSCGTASRLQVLYSARSVDVADAQLL